MAADDPETQRRGIVVIVYCVSGGNTLQKSDPTTERDLIVEIGTYMRFAAPVRVVGLHFLCDSVALKDTSRLIFSVLSRSVRLRFICHQGKVCQR